jgi:hypothetical protein
VKHQTLEDLFDDIRSMDTTHRESLKTIVECLMISMQSHYWGTVEISFKDGEPQLLFEHRQTKLKN